MIMMFIYYSYNYRKYTILDYSFIKNCYFKSLLSFTIRIISNISFLNFQRKNFTCFSQSLHSKNSKSWVKIGTSVLQLVHTFIEGLLFIKSIKIQNFKHCFDVLKEHFKNIICSYIYTRFYSSSFMEKSDKDLVHVDTIH